MLGSKNNPEPMHSAVVESRRVGYARVSTKQQETALQLAALRAAGVHTIVEEMRSGAAVRPALDGCLASLRPGDELVAYKIDRLARSLVDLLRILDRVAKAGATFRSLTEPIETKSPAGRMMVQMLGASAEIERAIIIERCQAGRAEAVIRGVRFGRREDVQLIEVLRLRGEGLTWREVGHRLGCDKATARRTAQGIRRCDGGPGEHRLRKRKST